MAGRSLNFKVVCCLGLAVILCIFAYYGISNLYGNRGIDKSLSQPRQENLIKQNNREQEDTEFFFDESDVDSDDDITDEELSIDQITDFYASEDAPERSTGYSTISHRFLDIANYDVDQELYRFIDDVIIGEAKIQLEYNCPEYQNFLSGNYSNVKQEIADAKVILKTMDQLFRTDIAIFTRQEYEEKFGEKSLELSGYEVVRKDKDNDRIVIRKKRKHTEKIVRYIDPELISPYVIDEESNNIGFRYKHNLFYDKGLATKELDCDNMVVNYLGPAEVMRLPLHFVPGIRHAYLAWELSNGEYICFETTSGTIKPESSYVKTRDHRKLKQKGYYFNPLSRYETIAEAYCIRGVAFFKNKDYFNSARNFCKAIKLNPRNIKAYKGAAISFCKLSYKKEAHLFFKQAKKLGLNLEKKVFYMHEQ